MPIYTVTSVEGCLDASKRAKIEVRQVYYPEVEDLVKS